MLTYFSAPTLSEFRAFRVQMLSMNIKLSTTSAKIPEERWLCDILWETIIEQKTLGYAGYFEVAAVRRRHGGRGGQTYKQSRVATETAANRFWMPAN